MAKSTFLESENIAKRCSEISSMATILKKTVLVSAENTDPIEGRVREFVRTS